MDTVQRHRLFRLGCDVLAVRTSLRIKRKPSDQVTVMLVTACQIEGAYLTRSRV